MQVDGNCCGSAIESHAHLFFSYPFSMHVWQRLVKCSLVQGMPDELGVVFKLVLLKSQGEGLRL